MGCLGSLEMLRERREPRRGCCQLTESQRKGALVAGSEDWPRDRLLMPIAPPWLQVSQGSLEFRRKKIHSKKRFDWACPKEAMPF